MTPVQPSVSVLLLGAGSGERFGGCPKAFVSYENATLLEHAVKAVEDIGGEIFIGLRSCDVSRGRATFGTRATVLPGGATRQETIVSLASQTTGAIIVVHDVARPFAKPELFRAVIDGARKHGASAAAVQGTVRDSLCQNDKGFAGAMVDRSTLMQIQTPQAFARDILLDILQSASDAARDETSLIGLCRFSGHPVQLIDGDVGNIKITYPGDLPEPAVGTTAG